MCPSKKYSEQQIDDNILELFFINNLSLFNSFNLMSNSHDTLLRCSVLRPLTAKKSLGFDHSPHVFTPLSLYTS